MNDRSRPAMLMVPTALTVVLLLSAACGEDPPAPAAAPEVRGRVPQQEFVDYRLIETSDGVRQWVLESDKMQKYGGQEEVQLVTVRMDFYREGNHFSTLISDSGLADLTTRDMHTWGNVVVVTDDGRQLLTSELFFDNTTQLITNDVFNRFTRGRDVTTGIGLEASADLESVVIQRDVVFDVTDGAVNEGTSQ